MAGPIKPFKPSWMRKPSHPPPGQTSHKSGGGGDPLYSSRPWRALRAVKLQQTPLCERCMREGKTTLAKVVHHLKDRRSSPELELDIDNCESLCHSCHNREHQSERHPIRRP